MFGALIGKLLGSAVVGGITSLLGGGSFGDGLRNGGLAGLTSGIFGGENSPLAGIFNGASDPAEQAVMLPGSTGAPETSPSPAPRPAAGAPSAANVAVQRPAGNLISGLLGGQGGIAALLPTLLAGLGGMGGKNNSSAEIPEGWGEALSDEIMAEHYKRANIDQQYAALSPEQRG